MKQGDTFFLTQTAIGTHLYVILSDCNQNGDQLVSVNLSSWSSVADSSCVVEAGEHPFVTEKSFMYYQGARIFETKFISTYGKLHQPVSGVLLDRMIEGAEVSARMPTGVRQFLAEQQIIAL